MSWPIEKALACLKLIVHSEFLPKIPEEDLEDFKGMAMFGNREKLLDFVKMVYKKSKKGLEIYGRPEDMLDTFEKLNEVPEFIQFSLKGELHPPFACHLLSFFNTYSDNSKNFRISSRKDCIFKMYKQWSEYIMDVDIDDMDRKFYKCWLMGYICKALRELKGTYDLILADSFEKVCLELRNLYESNNNRKRILPKGPITYKLFLDLEKYFCEEEQELVPRFLIASKIKNDITPKNKDVYKKTYAEIVFLIEETQKIFDKNIEFFTPFSRGELAQPVIRHFKNDRFNFYLAEEVGNALKIAMDFEDLPDDLNIVEPFNDRKLGIVYGIELNFFEKILKDLNIPSDRFITIEVPLTDDQQSITLPIISAYGTHCLTSIDAFDSIIYYLANVLKVFQKCAHQHSLKVSELIGNVLSSLFVEKRFLYFVEVWKINEVIEELRKDLSKFLTEPVDVITLKPMYTSQELTTIFKNSTKNIGLFRNSSYIGHSSIYKHLMKEDRDFPKNINFVYGGCFLLAREYFLNSFKEFAVFEKNQNEHSGRLTPIQKKSGNSSSAENQKEIDQLRNELQDLKQQNEILRGENVILHDITKKLSVFPQKAEAHRKELEDTHGFYVDLIWTRLQRLNVKYPDSGEVIGAKHDVRKLEECLEEYVEKVKNEYQ